MCKCCHHTWCKFCVSFLFNSPVGLPFSVGMSQLVLLCSRLSPDVLALWPSLSVARTGQPERVVRETDGRHGAGRGAGFSVAGTTPFPAPPSRGRCRRACSSGQGAAPRDSGPFCPRCPEAHAVSPGLQAGVPPCSCASSCEQKPSPLATGGGSVPRDLYRETQETVGKNDYSSVKSRGREAWP